MNKKRRWAFYFRQYAIVFQAEVFLILGDWQAVTICTNSETALRTLRSPLNTLKTVQECKNRLSSISGFNTMELLQVRQGNEMDILSKGVQFPSMSGSESAVGVLVTFVNVPIKNWS